MFENIRYIKTKDLYLCQLKLVRKVQNGIVYFYQEYNQFILARKVVKDYKNYYQDMFTKSLYENDIFPIYETGKVYVVNVMPIISNLSFISKAEASEILANKNYIIMNQNYQITYSEDNGFFNFENKSNIKKLIKK